MKGIYKITAPSGEVYIGQSVDIKRRVKDHRTTKKCKHKKLAASFDLHGVANHSFEVVHELPNDIDLATMHLYEQIYMDAYRDCGIALLNIKEAGYGKHGDETKLIIKEKRAFQVFSHESRLKLSASLKKVSKRGAKR
jgi:group I intron endonuclease